MLLDMHRALRCHAKSKRSGGCADEAFAGCEAFNSRSLRTPASHWSMLSTRGSLSTAGLFEAAEIERLPGMDQNDLSDQLFRAARHVLRAVLDVLQVSDKRDRASGVSSVGDQVKNDAGVAVEEFGCGIAKRLPSIQIVFVSPNREQLQAR